MAKKPKPKLKKVSAAAPKKSTPPPGKRWVKGQSGNPLGGKLHNPAVKAVAKLTRDELVEISALVVKGDVAALRKIKKSKTSQVLHAMVASVALRCLDEGDMKNLDLLLNRLIGKVKDEVHHSGDAFVPPQVIITLPSNGREAKVS